MRVSCAAMELATRWLVLLLLASAAPALAQPPRAVVLRFEGWRSNETREAVVSALAPEVALVDEAQAVTAAQELGVDVSTPEGMARVVRHLGIVLVIAGSVEGRGRAATATLYVLDDAGDELVERSAPQPEAGAAAVEAAREAQEILARRNAPEPEPEAEPEPEPVVVPPELPAPAPPRWTPKQVIALGGIRIRHVGTYVGDASGNVHFLETTPYPEIALELAFRPWFSAPDELRGIFLAAQGSFSVGTSYLASTGEARSMTSLRFALDAGYAHRVEDIVEIGGTLGIGVEGVQIDAPVAFPSTLFTFLRPALIARVRAFSDLLVVEGGLGARIGLDGGPLAAAYGPGFLFGGVDAFAGVAGTVEPGFTWAARLGYLHHTFGFSGGGGSMAAGTGGIDQAIDVRLLVGWAI
jgi:hypothetical protein